MDEHYFVTFLDFWAYLLEQRNPFLDVQETKCDAQEFECDDQQLQEFVRELTANQGRIRAFVVTLMPGSPDVGDVLQETNLVLWKSRSRFRPGSNFLAWAFTIARLEVLHHRARVKRRNGTLISDELLELLAEELPPTGDHEVYLNALENCKSKLTDAQRALIDYRYTPGYSIEAYSLKTGRTASSLRVSLMRIRAALRACVEKSLDQNPA